MHVSYQCIYGILFQKIDDGKAPDDFISLEEKKIDAKYKIIRCKVKTNLIDGNVISFYFQLPIHRIKEKRSEKKKKTLFPMFFRPKASLV